MTQHEFIQRYVIARLAAAKDHERSGLHVKAAIAEAKGAYSMIQDDQGIR